MTEHHIAGGSENDCGFKTTFSWLSNIVYAQYTKCAKFKMIFAVLYV